MWYSVKRDGGLGFDWIFILKPNADRYRPWFPLRLPQDVNPRLSRVFRSFQGKGEEWLGRIGRRKRSDIFHRPAIEEQQYPFVRDSAFCLIEQYRELRYLQYD